MRIHRFLLAAWTVAAVEVAGCAPDPPAAILLVTIDTLRPDHLSHNGYRRATSPTLDAVAATGLVFELARSHAPLTAPAHASLLTGRLPAWHRVLTNGDILDDGAVTLAERLAAAGFETAAFIGNANLTRVVNFQQGFGHYDDALTDREGVRPQPERSARATVDATLAWLATHHTRPFFCWVHLQDPHGPYVPPPEDAASFLLEAEREPPRPLPLLTNQSGRAGIPAYQALGDERNANVYVARYDGEIRHTDAEVGRLLVQLAAWRIDPLLIVTADHGEALGDHDYYFAHGQDLTEDQVRVPLILRGPGVPVGQRVRTPVDHLDVVPTVLRHAGIPVPSDLPGRDLLALVPNDQATVAQGFPEGWAIATATHKLIAWPTRRAVFDLTRDPGETRDIAASAPADTAALEAALTTERARPEPPWPRRSAQREMLRDQLRALGYLE